MKNDHQQQIRRELEQHIPRGAVNSPQNWLRFAFVFYRSRNHGFDESVALAVDRVKKTNPDFIPDLR